APRQVGPVAVLGAGLDDVLDDVDAVRVADLDALTRTEPMPDLVLVAGFVTGFGAGVGGTADKPGGPAGARAATVRMLALLQRWLAGGRFAGSRLVVVTCGAAGPEVTDLSGSAVWGLVRSARSEHPGRFGLLDIEPGADVASGLAVLAGGEPEVAVRSGV